MTAKEILNWFGWRQGTATKADIRRVWFSLPDYDLPPGEVERGFKEIGVEVD